MVKMTDSQIYNDARAAYDYIRIQHPVATGILCEAEEAENKPQIELHRFSGLELT